MTLQPASNSISYNPEDAMKHTNSFLLAAALLSAGLLATPAQAQFFSERHGQRERMDEHVAKIYEQLDLTDQQRELLKQNKERHKTAKAALAPQLKDTMQALGDELKKKDVDTAKVNALKLRLKICATK